MTELTIPQRRHVRFAVVVAALGYFVDIYDLLLFGIVRVKSLVSLGIPEAQLLDYGVRLLNMQMAGLLLGGIIWGILGDRRGRLSVLFGSILLYSVANIANGFVASVEAYAWLRFFAGVGLAGELGAGITLVSELMPKETRGYGTALVASVGLAGAVVAALVGDLFPWRTAYFIGGGLGLALLVLRVGVAESGMFKAALSQRVSRGNFLSLFSSWNRLKRYGAVILIGIPIWYVVGILVTLSPELGVALGLKEVPSAGRAILWTYAGLVVGDFVSGWLGQVFKSRKKAAGLFIGLTMLSVALYFVVGGTSLSVFYAICCLLGFATGYWAVFMTIASEQFGTNLRATATTTVPNFVRGSVVPVTFAFQAARTPLGLVGSAIAVGLLVFSVALLALASLDETYGKDLDFLET